MSAPQKILDHLAAAEKPPTVEELMAAAGCNRYRAVTVLGALSSSGRVQLVPATYVLTDAGRQAVAERRALADRRRANAEHKQAMRSRNARKRRAAPTPLTQPQPAAPLHLGQMVDHALRTQPNSVFALGSMS
ncbi:hypothetical protein [Variovorax sp.]|uniref:hypothetical protein n=1 Tax=Variovorax sp. TaxID=1871043 RepID=UPI003BAB7A69